MKLGGAQPSARGRVKLVSSALILLVLLAGCTDTTPPGPVDEGSEGEEAPRLQDGTVAEGDSIAFGEAVALEADGRPISVGIAAGFADSDLVAAAAVEAPNGSHALLIWHSRDRGETWTPAPPPQLDAAQDPMDVTLVEGPSSGFLLLVSSTTPEGPTIDLFQTDDPDDGWEPVRTPPELPGSGLAGITGAAFGGPILYAEASDASELQFWPRDILDGEDVGAERIDGPADRWSNLVRVSEGSERDEPLLAAVRISGGAAELMTRHGEGPFEAISIPTLSEANILEGPWLATDGFRGLGVFWSEAAGEVVAIRFLTTADDGGHWFGPGTVATTSETLSSIGFHTGDSEATLTWVEPTSGGSTTVVADVRGLDSAYREISLGELQAPSGGEGPASEVPPAAAPGNRAPFYVFTPGDRGAWVSVALQR